MTVIKQPNVSINVLAAAVSVANTDQKVLFVGQQVAAGSAVSGELQQNIQNDNSWDTLFGSNSMLAGMLRAARAINSVVRFDAIGLDDAAGTASTGTITATGAATEAGTVDVIIGSRKNHTFTVSIADAATPTDVAASIVAAVNADVNVPVTASNVAGVVTLTADNDGTVANYISIVIEGSVAGITLAIAAMSSGATDPTLTSVFDAIGSERYQTIVWPYADMSVLKTLLDARFNVTNDVLDGVGVVALTDTLANLKAVVVAENSESLAVLVDEKIDDALYKGSAVLEFDYVKASQFAAIRSLRLQKDSNISHLVTSTNGALDSFGGPALASKPYFNTPFSDLPQIGIGHGFTATEIESLLTDGGFVIGNNSAGNETVLGEVVTTYKTDSSGNPDVSFKYLNYVDTISTIREYFFNNLKSRFAQTRLTEGALIRGRDIANGELIEAYCTQLFTELSGEGYVLTQAGEDALKYYIDNLSVTLDMANGKVTITMLVPIVTQLRTIVATMQMSFSTTG